MHAYARAHVIREMKGSRARLIRLVFALLSTLVVCVYDDDNVLLFALRVVSCGFGVIIMHVYSGARALVLFSL